MPGIFGIISPQNQDYVKQGLEIFENLMNPTGSLNSDRHCTENATLGFGRISLGVFNHYPQPVSNDNCTIIFHGELNHAQPGRDADYILARFQEKGEKCFGELNGIFHFLLFDKNARKIFLVSDKFGLQPLYYTHSAKFFGFAGEAKALSALPFFDKSIDYQSIGDFFHYGQILGNKTLFKNLKLLPPASFLTYELETGTIKIEEYWQLETLFRNVQQKNFSQSMNDAVTALKTSIENRSSLHDSLGLSLSGGLDSRTILAGLQEKSVGISTYTLGLPGCTDQKLAQKMAKIGQTRHEFLELDQRYLNNFEQMTEQMIWLSDGMYHPHESTEILALEYFKRAPFKILLRGHGGEIAKAALAYPVMVHPEMYKIQDKNSALNYIFNITNLGAKDIDLGRLIHPNRVKQIQSAPNESLLDSIGSLWGEIAAPDLCIFYYIREHIRRQVVASLEIFRSTVEIRMPFVEEYFMAALFQLPTNQRKDGELHRQFVAQYMPQLVKVPNSNTGAPLNASALRLFVTDKFHSIMKRFSILGFRHYTEFQKWYRTHFRESLQSILFSSTCAQRGIYEQQYLKEIVDRHISGKANYAHFLGTAAALEIWFRKFAD